MPMVLELLAIGQCSGHPNLLKSLSRLFSFRIVALSQKSISALTSLMICAVQRPGARSMLYT